MYINDVKNPRKRKSRVKKTLVGFFAFLGALLFVLLCVTLAILPFYVIGHFLIKFW